MASTKSRVASAGESSPAVKPTATSMKSAATAVESSSTTAMASPMLSQRHLRQPGKRKHRRNPKYDSNQNSLFHITTLGSRSHNP
jgi:hypothetical protein